MHCIICETKTIGYRHPKFDILFHECLSCKVIFKDPSHHLSKKAEFAVYELHQNTLENQGYVDYLTAFIETAILPHQKTRGLKALDFGSGPGPVLAHLLTHTYGYQTDIYDPFYAPNEVFDDKTYDLITCTEVIEHIKKPKETFDRFKNHLSSNGILAMMTLFHPEDRHLFFDWFYIRDPSHIVFYTPHTIQILAERCGLKLIEHNAKRAMTLKHQ